MQFRKLENNFGHVYLAATSAVESVVRFLSIFGFSFPIIGVSRNVYRNIQFCPICPDLRNFLLPA